MESGPRDTMTCVRRPSRFVGQWVVRRPKTRSARVAKSVELLSDHRTR